jgi:DNA-binding HxlR family transcriptional regulator
MHSRDTERVVAQCGGQGTFDTRNHASSVHPERTIAVMEKSLSMNDISANFKDMPVPGEGEYVAAREILCRVGDKWSLYVVRCLQDRPLRFNELRRSIDGISQRMLTLTLRSLERDGLITRTVYASKPPRVDYELTEIGLTLVDPVVALLSWAEQNRIYIHYSRRNFDEQDKMQPVFEIRR